MSILTKKIAKADKFSYAISTNTNHKVSLSEAVGCFAPAGLKKIEVQLEHRTRHADKDPLELSKLLDLKLRYGLHYSGHAPYKREDIASSDDLKRMKGINNILDTFPFFKALGVKIVTIHTGMHDPQAVENIARSLDILVPRAADYGMLICLETAGRADIYNVLKVFEYSQLCQATGCGLTLDLPHIQCTLGEVGMYSSLKQLLTYTQNIHVSDCFMGVHQHYPLGRGTFPFERVFKILGENSYQGQVTVDAYHGLFNPQDYLNQAVNFKNYYSHLLE